MLFHLSIIGSFYHWVTHITHMYNKRASGFSWAFDIRNKASLNISVESECEHKFSFLLSKYFKRELLSHKVNVYLYKKCPGCCTMSSFLSPAEYENFSCFAYSLCASLLNLEMQKT